MVIYGTALLAVCLLLGLACGQTLGLLLGIDKNIGGVGIAMLLLIVSAEWLRRRGQLKEPESQGIMFWSSIYVPIVVAMAASQNVWGALTGGGVALLAGFLSVGLCFAAVPLLSRWGAPGRTGGTASDGESLS